MWILYVVLCISFSPRAYFFKVNMKEGKLGGMKEIFDTYKNMHEDEKKKFMDKYNQVSLRE